MADAQAVNKVSSILKKYDVASQLNSNLSPGKSIALCAKQSKMMLQDKSFNTVNRPRFLDKLERHIEVKLRTLPASTNRLDARLQIFREVFDMLLNEFHIYKPILSKIKAEYEYALAFYHEGINKIEPLKEVIWTLSREYDQRVLSIQNQENETETKLKAKLLQLEKQLSDIREEKTGLIKDAEVLSAQLMEEYKCYRDEADARRLLISDLGELRQQFDELQVSQQEEKMESGSKEDPIMLRMALDEAMKAHGDLLRKISKMETDYVEVMPKCEYEDVVKKLEACKEYSDNLNVKFIEMEETVNLMKAQLDAVQMQRDEFSGEITEMKRSYTPRPDWNDLNTSVPLSSTYWNKLTTGKSTVERVRLLLKDVLSDSLLVNASDIDAKQDFSGIGPSGYLTLAPSSVETIKQTQNKPLSTGDIELTLQSKGTDETVPRFLRLEKHVQIPYRRIGLRDCLLLCNQIWTQRKEQTKKASQQSNIGDRDSDASSLVHGANKRLSVAADASFDVFLEAFFNHWYGLPIIRIEWAYGFMAALEAYAEYISDLAEIRGIVKNEVDEACHWRMEERILRFERLLANNVMLLKSSATNESQPVDAAQISLDSSPERNGIGDRRQSSMLSSESLQSSSIDAKTLNSISKIPLKQEELRTCLAKLIIGDNEAIESLIEAAFSDTKSINLHDDNSTQVTQNIAALAPGTSETENTGTKDDTNITIVFGSLFEKKSNIYRTAFENALIDHFRSKNAVYLDAMGNVLKKLKTDNQALIEQNDVRKALDIMEPSTAVAGVVEEEGGKEMDGNSIAAKQDDLAKESTALLPEATQESLDATQSDIGNLRQPSDSIDASLRWLFTVNPGGIPASSLPLVKILSRLPGCNLTPSE